MRKIFPHLLLIAIATTTLLPFLWMVLASFKPLAEVEKLNPLPTVWHPENYQKVFEQVPFARYYFNSVFVAAWVTFLTCLTSAMAGFGFARLQWPGRDKVFQLYLGTMMIPGVVTMIPNYGSFFWPLVMIKSEHLRTLPIGMLFFDSVYGRQTNLIMAASVMNIIPLVILFVTCQRFLVKGIQLGAVKG